MPISIKCPKCGAKLKAPDKLAGKKAKCKCGNVVAVPKASRGPQVSAAASATSDGPALPNAASPAAGAPSPAPRWRPMTARICPNCQAKMEPGDIVCTECGFHTEKGIVIPLAPSAKAKSPGAEQRLATRKAGATAASAGAASFGEPAKRRLRPIVLAVATVAALSVIGAIMLLRSNPGPGESALATLTRGMTVEEVVQRLGKPQAIYAYHSDNRGGLLGGANQTVRIDYAENLMQAYGKERFREGFYLVYRAGGTAEHQVNFDAEGKMVASRDVPNPPPR